MNLIESFLQQAAGNLPNVRNPVFVYIHSLAPQQAAGNSSALHFQTKTSNKTAYCIMSYTTPKKFLLIGSLLLLSMFIILFPGISHPAIRFSIPHDTIALDGNSIVPINLTDNNPEGFCSWNISLEYDPNILTYLEMVGTQLTGGYIFLYPYEIYPGRINIAGGVEFDSVTGEDFPTKGTGTFLLFNFTTKRQYPMWKTKSDIKMTFKNSLGNSLRYAICDHGSLEVLPTLGISNIDLSKDISGGYVLTSIYGQGFSEDPNGIPIPIVGSVRFSDNIVYITGNLITIQIPYDSFPPGLLFDVIVTNPNGDFGIFKDGYGLEHRFETGLNLFGYPAIPPDGYEGSFGFLSNLGEPEGNIKCLRAFDPNNSGWMDTYWDNNQPAGTDFRISCLQSYLMYVEGAGFSKAFPGYNYEAGMEDQISEIAEKAESGMNLITLHPAPDESFHSDKVVQKFSQETGLDIAISRIESKSAKWQTTFPFFGRINGAKFPIQNMNGYILYCQ